MQDAVPEVQVWDAGPCPGLGRTCALADGRPAESARLGSVVWPARDSLGLVTVWLAVARAKSAPGSEPLTPVGSGVLRFRLFKQHWVRQVERGNRALCQPARTQLGSQGLSECCSPGSRRGGWGRGSGCIGQHRPSAEPGFWENPPLMSGQAASSVFRLSSSFKQGSEGKMCKSYA